MLEDFLEDKKSILKNNIRLPYRIIPKTSESNVRIKDCIRPDEVVAFSNYENFKGYLDHLFVLNPSIDIYFNELQDEISYNPYLEALSLSNIIKMRLFIIFCSSFECGQTLLNPLLSND
ncbi:hypothetical protein [Methanolobus psychrotolerans]|uniref:hypothetical protein n=1 Tax=Methanolobus psychrotolerans TaxID=1874706 RepID=UPI000B91827C|nr:hypothetical protein [Methanolobus psychrotolerans]